MATIKLLGATQDGTGNSITNGYIVMTKFTASVSGSMIEFLIKCNASGNVQVGIYTDATGSPVTLLAQVASTAVTSGWNTITISSVNIVSGTTYWLAFNSDTYGLVAYSLSGGASKYKLLTYGTSFPDPAGSSYTTTQWECMLKGYGNPTSIIKNINGLEIVSVNNVNGLAMPQ